MNCAEITTASKNLSQKGTPLHCCDSTCCVLLDDTPPYAPKSSKPFLKLGLGKCQHTGQLHVNVGEKNSKKANEVKMRTYKPSLGLSLKPAPSNP